ncbi:sulfate adenylyltransferase subunit CysN [Ferrimonas gelatinilytica]|uniref:Sulfate adenylyltransferase subunit 1 n=1 Tax=Ferrimonas gelatinilytica TaxID=1255257 RepID=A0ABP9RUS9_9GAMM
MNAHNALIEQDILAYLKQHEQKELLRFITCGSVDDGKSTLIGRLLHDAKMIFDDQLAALSRDSQRSGTTGEKLDLALLVDGLQSEREQGITIDVAYRYFATDKRKFIIADTPGHEQYTRNMATGASTADLAIILIDARHGVQEQTRRHSYLVALLGIRQVIVAVNKMDLVAFDGDRFDAIVADYRHLADALGLQQVQFVPLSALDGDNVVGRSARTPWYSGEPLMTLLETLPLSRDSSHLAFRLPVQYVNRPHSDFRGFAGTLAAGRVCAGDAVVAMPSGRETFVKSIVTFDGEHAEAHAGEAVTLTLADEIDLSRGEMLVAPEALPCLSTRLQANLVWMAQTPMQPKREYGIKLATQSGTAWVEVIEERIDVNTLDRHPAQLLGLNEIGSVILGSAKPLLFDRYRDNRTTGAFILIDKINHETVAAGMILNPLPEKPQRVPSGESYSEFELALNALVRQHFPHWNARDLLAESGARPEQDDTP